jgi:1-acyl-sn-glycerol-3-phosphate acyltransferase
MLAAVASTLYWTLGASILLLLAFSVGLLLPVTWTRKIGQNFIHWSFAGYTLLLRLFGIIRVEFLGFEKLRQEKRGYILAPNHPALWDAVLILGKVKGLTCILKASLLRNPLLLGGARLARFIPGTPLPAMLRQCIAALDEGQNLLLFPEATRTRVKETVLNELKGGIGIIASKTKSPIWPVVIQTSSSYLSKGHPIWHWPEKGPIHIRLSLQPPLEPGDQDDAQDIVEQLRQRYLLLLSASSDEVAHSHTHL